MFEFLKETCDAETGQNHRLTAQQFIVLTQSDEKLSMPVYPPGIRSEAQCDDLGSSISGMWIVLLALSAFLLTVKPLLNS